MKLTTRPRSSVLPTALLAAMVTAGSAGLALAGAGHGGGHEEGKQVGPVPQSLEEMREMHKAHGHPHDFEAMKEMSADEFVRVMALMTEIGVAVPPMDPVRGRELFAEKGCVVCHAVNGIGGELGPPLNADDLPRPMSAFEFAARMWRGAQAMTALQEDLLGEVISLTGQDLADLIAFAHDPDEQERLTEDQVPARFRALIAQE